MQETKLRARELLYRAPALAAMISVLLAGPLDGVLAATPSIKAKAGPDKKTQKLLVTGKTAGLSPNSQVSVYDTSDHRLIFSGQTDAKSAFNFSLMLDQPPCQVQLEAGATKAVVAVTGADKTCKTKPACSIVGGARNVAEGSSQSFETISKSKGLNYSWDFGDGGKATGQSGVSHAYKTPGLFVVTAVGEDVNGAQCTDAVTVSVAPPQGSNPKGAVPESARPKIAAGMPGKNGENDKDAVVVFPFEDMGMQGGSQINIPFNPLVPYNAMNAQVIQKIPQKPALLGSSAVNVVYSAASNPVDPYGAGSINSTSQNLFANGAGANFDPSKSSRTATVYIDDHSYDKAVIAKSEFWDKARWPNASKLTTPVTEAGLSQADVQNTYTPAKPIALPDQGLYGYIDKAQGVRSMPGVANPYVTNDPQPFNFNAEQQSFVAQNIPATPVDDQGKTNPFPLLRIEAKENGKTVAATDAVYTAASETGCVSCHIKGEKGSDDAVWRTPVTIDELVNKDGSRGPATGQGAFPFPADYPSTITLTGDAIADFKKYGYGPAVHNKFDGKFPLNPSQTMVAPGIVLEYDENGIRKDRVAESRWLKPDGSISSTNPNKDATWKLQIRLKFRDGTFYGDDTPQNREKAARWNTMLLHDYMTPINYNNARDDVFAEYADDKYTARAAVTICASHHTSTFKQDYGAAAVSQVRTLSDWTRTTHAFHGKMQVYKADISSGADKKPHKQGELIRDERGHPMMWGGRGWDTIDNDANGLPLTKDANGQFTVKQTVPAFVARNNWDPVQFPQHSQGEEMLPVGENVPMEKNCLTCHTGKTEKSYRDIHHAAGMKCDSCHGGMLAVGLTYPNELYDGNLTMAGSLGVDDPKTLTAPDFRRAWLDEPDCGSCHVGDANFDQDGEQGLKHYYSAGALKQGWQDNDKANASIFPVNARFAVMPTTENRPEKLAATDADVAAGRAAKKGDTIYVDRMVSQALYRKSGDVHGSGANGILNCSTCHGGSHGIWPNKDPNANDNVTSKQLQGYDGNIAECSTCHIKDDFKTGLVATDGGASGLGVAQGVREGNVVAPTSAGKAFLAGPHGMHPVGDEYWYKHAEGAAASSGAGKHNTDQNGGWHNDMAKKPGPDGEDQCAACHGDDHKGTRLSRTLVDRVLINEKGKSIKVVKDQIIGCDLCHSLKESFAGAPEPNSPTGGWPKAKLHAPPQPEPVTSTGTGGGGGHGH